MEELNNDVQVVRLLWLVENFFEYEGKEYRELELYFLMQLPDESKILQQIQPFYGTEGGVLFMLQWIPYDAETLSKLPLYPSFLRTALLKLPETTQYIIH